MLRAVKGGRWVTHINGVQADPAWRGWLVDTMSLTQKLIAHAQQFRVRRLRQARALCLHDESALAGLPRRRVVREREVLLECDGVPVVYAHTIVPLSATAGDWPFFGGLGERSLGTTLFGDPRVRRSSLQFARLRTAHPLAARARAAAGLAGGPLLARRCLYRRKKGRLLVTEVFLPSLLQLKTPRRTSFRVQS